MTSHINSVLKQALATFTCKPELFTSNLNALKNILDKTRAEDVNLNPELLTEALWERPDKAPVSCIDIYEDCNLTIGIFILKPGGHLPLHNHPEMYGLIKVLAGKVQITSYSLNTPKTLEVDRRSFKGANVPPMNFLKKDVVTAELTCIDYVDANSKPCVLEPHSKNLHEIVSIEGPAAFLDILAPPYNTRIENNGIRLCSYYTVLSQVAPNVLRLKEIKSPSYYWTDMSPYTGPELRL